MLGFKATAMNAISNCTILIPTHNRPGYLSRCVRWFSDFGCPIVIADSSVSPSCGGLQSDNITHVHCPGGFEVYPRKLQLAMRQVTTPLVAMCADDDFIAKEGLKASASFLERNSDYAFSQGYAYLYQTFRHRIALWPMVYPYHDNVSERWIERIVNAKSTVYYGVNRTDILRSAVDFVAKQDFAEIIEGFAGFVDTAITMHVARAGKFKRCAVPFAFREYSVNVNAVGRRFGTIVSRNTSDFYRNLLASLTGDDQDPDVRQQLLRLFAADYAGQITFDLAASVSRKVRLQKLPPSLLQSAEYLFRIFAAARLYGKPEYREFLKTFSTADYRRFRNFVTESGSAI
ncbi:MAG: TIGR00180 family glycosyltransferase [Afipia sp.]